MGLRGPPPLPNSQRVATHAARELPTPSDHGAQPLAEDPTWHDVAKIWYRSHVDTPQAAAYTASDWGFAWTEALCLSEAAKAGDYRAVHAIQLDADQRLMTTRRARLASHLDIDDEATGDRADVVALQPSNEELRQRVFGGA